MATARQILICDDDSMFQLSVKHSLTHSGQGKFECRTAMNGDEALAIIKKYPIEAVLLDIQMRTPDEGLRYLPQIKEADPDLAIIVISGNTEFNTVREAMRLGAVDYVPKDFEPDNLVHIIERALERRFLVTRSRQQNFETAAAQKRHVLLGKSQGMQMIRKTIERLRNSRANVMITGETGTGKELVARNLRATLPDGALAPFVAVDSGAILSTTAESMLFGHEKGAFTGADRMVKGVFEEGNGGIVYFDEIGNMPLNIQSKLLRVLQEKEVVRLGAAKPLQLDFRVVCATNHNLEAMATQGEFKEDLLQRLNVLPIHLPPLRERPEDIPELIEHFLKKHDASRKLNFTEGAVDLLQKYSWPGNVRELGNLIAYVSAMVEGEEIDISDLPPKIRDRAYRCEKSPGEKSPSEKSFYEQVADFEKRILADEYARLGGNISQLAMKLGMDRSHLYTKLKEYGLHAARSGTENKKI